LSRTSPQCSKKSEKKQSCQHLSGRKRIRSGTETGSPRATGGATATRGTASQDGNAGSHDRGTPSIGAARAPAFCSTWDGHSCLG
jgi:hypothetical protein